ncbi:MAG TPA: adenylate/guanylate cyclase domain-containing protein [Methylococcaceae bacterium]|nr:adenylate/guanylate cyclase domain-containing protein [Methylococcaceae bacterium]
MKWLRQPIVVALLLGLAVWSVLAPLRMLGGLQALELRAYDSVLSWRTGERAEPPIVLIGETEPDIRRYGHPLPDAVLAAALEKLLALGARVVGVDKYRDVPVAPGTERLNEVLRANPSLIWIFFVGNEEREHIPPPAVLEGGGQAGFNDMVDDPDGISRRGLLFLDENGATHYSFPLLLALHYLARDDIQPEGDEEGFLKLNGASFRPLRPDSGGYAGIDAGGYQLLLDYPYLDRSFATFTLSELLDGKVDAELVRDRVALIGAMAPSLGDYRLLPGGVRRYGVEQHGHVIAQLLDVALRGHPVMRGWPGGGEYAWLLLWCLAGGLASLWRVGIVRLGLLGLGGPALLTLVAWTAFRQGWWIPLVPPVLGWLGALAAGVVWFSSQERAERRQLLNLFERHVSPQVVTALWETRDEFFNKGSVRPDQLTATVLFTDLANFTSVAESMEPLTLMNWLNRYMDEMSNIVIAEGGMINKYIGDAIMAVFGAPVRRYDAAGIAADAASAVESALRMGEKLKEMNRIWREEGLPTVGMRVGIHTGPLVAGTFGGKQRMEYTVIGDTVNTASRLESFDKSLAPPDAEHPCRILVGETTWRHVREHYVTEEVGSCQLKGKQNALKIYRVLDRLASHSKQGPSP